MANNMSGNTVDAQKLCLALLNADSETVAIDLLKKAGYWDKQNAWRFYGDKEGNWSQIGAQQARPESSLTEKITNAIDARLMRACLAAGIDPESPKAPRSVTEAVAKFFGAGSAYGPGNTLTEWMDEKRTTLSREITIAVTGERKTPCITICDLGEGQRPERIAETFVSLDKQNKIRIHFLHGRFNMGGSGVLPFCGTENLQLIISRRSPDAAKTSNESSQPDVGQWGFTIVRREDTGGRNSVYTYLAPIDSEKSPRRGRVLRFAAKELALLPAGTDPYKRLTQSGSLLKLYDYDVRGFAGNAILPDGLRSRLEACFPHPALPIRVHECREGFRGHKGSFETLLIGLGTRLDDNTADNLEPGFPDSVQFSVEGQRLTARVYAFKAGKASTYVKNEGVILTVDGQTHGTIPRTFFNRKAVNMDRLASSLVLMVDCSKLSQRTREVLFMTSRDRLRRAELTKILEDQLEEIVGHHQGLKELRERRKREEVEERLKDDQPLEQVLAKLLQSSPELGALFPPGLRIGNPMKSGGGKEGDGNGGSGKNKFEGKTHPTFFRFEKRSYGQTLIRNFEVGRKCRIRMETDAVNDYFKRDENPGVFLVSVDEEAGQREPNWSITLHDGVASISLDFDESVKVGDVVTVSFTLADPTLTQPFVNVARLAAATKSEREGGESGEKSGSNQKGEKSSGPGGLALPTIIRVKQDKWATRNFDSHSACAVVRDDKNATTFYINVDNAFLKHAQKVSKQDARVVEARFVFGNVLVGLAVLQRFQQLEKSAKSDETESNDESPAQRLVSIGLPKLVAEVTQATAPFLLPMIDRLGSLSQDAIESLAQAGDED